MPDSIEFTVRKTQGVPDYRGRIYRVKKNKTALLIPVLNEGTRILRQLEELNLINLNVDIVIADGGSNDLTQENIEKNIAIVYTFLTMEDSGALSTQLRMGFHYCLSQNYDSVITMDGNNKDDPNGIQRIQEALESGIDFVQGSRFISGGESVNTPLLRYIAIRFLHAPLTSLGAKFWFTDSTNGFRGHSAGLLGHPELGIFRKEFDSYELLAYIPVRARQVGLSVREVPVTRRYPKGVVTPTKIHGARAKVNILIILLRVLTGRYCPVKIKKS